MEDLGERVALRVSFLKAGAELSGPLFVCGHFCTPHNVCSCYMLRGIQLEEMGNSIFSPKNFKSLKKSTFWKKIVNNWVLYSKKTGKNEQCSWSGTEIMLIIRAVIENLSLGGNYWEFYHSDCLFPSFFPLFHVQKKGESLNKLKLSCRIKSLFNIYI